jgi:hypothetical protein
MDYQCAALRARELCKNLFEEGEIEASFWGTQA